MMFIEPPQAYFPGYDVLRKAFRSNFIQPNTAHSEADPRIMSVFTHLPVEQDTLLRIVLMCLSGLPVGQEEALDWIQRIVLRAVSNQRIVCRQYVKPTHVSFTVESPSESNAHHRSGVNSWDLPTNDLQSSGIEQGRIATSGS